MCIKKNVYEQLTVCCMGGFLLSVPWYDFMNKQIFPFSCNHQMLSHIELNFKMLIVGEVRFENLGISLG